MPYLQVENFRAGLDSRRMYETNPAGTLLQCSNAHITQGGEIEQRRAFVLDATLPSTTFGLYAFRGELIVFGSAAGVVVPSGYRYIQLTIPAGEPMVRVHKVTPFAGKLYVICEFNDGTVHHFYDGARVIDWFDGRAKAEIQITGGNLASSDPGVQQVTRIDFAGTPVATTDTIASVSITLTGGEAASLSTAIAAIVSDLQASGVFAQVTNNFDDTITVTYLNAGVIDPAEAVVDGDFGDPGGLTYTHTVLTAGVDPVSTSASTIDAIYADGVDMLQVPVQWQGSAETTAQAVAVEINTRVSNPDYEASAINDRVVISAADSGTAANGRVLTADSSNGMTYTFTIGTFAGGSTLAATYSIGIEAVAAKSKMYALADTLCHFSELNNPAEWNPPAVGAGFIDMAAQAPETGDLKAIAPYYDFHAIFSENIVQIWQFDVDEGLNTQRQLLNNIGTIAPKSVVSFSANDVFFLHYTGIRSLRARDTTTSAAVTDIGTSIDELIQDVILQSPAAARSAIGIVNQADGRYWLSIGSTIYVFSYFPGSKISAWSTYEPGFVPDHLTNLSGQIAVRSGDDVYLYGGPTGDEYDDSEVTVWLPYLDAGKAATDKMLLALDFAAQGEWSVEVSTDHRRTDSFQYIGTSTGTSYSKQTIAAVGMGTHISARFTKASADRGRLGGVAIHYNLGEAL